MGEQYDVIIIGSGIGGLTAGAYLAKSGLRLRIVERAEKVGGYCGTFVRDDYRFDEAVHYINNLGPGGFLRQICEELELNRLVSFIAIDPSDVLLMPGLQISIQRDVDATVENISAVFPEDAKSVQNFFSLIKGFDFAFLYATWSGKTFQELLDRLFHNQRLKTVLGLFATTMGLPPTKLSALSALAYYRGSILDGGYHPVGGAQSFSDALSSRFKSYGGQLTLKNGARRILVASGKVQGVELESGEIVYARTVISNCDATQTFEQLLGEDHVGRTLLKRLRGLKPSLSTLVAYLGVELELKQCVPDCCNLWYFPYSDLQSGSIDIVEDSRLDGYVHIGFSSLHDRTMAPKGCESLVVFSGASYRTQKFWAEHKEQLGNVLVERVCRIIPQLYGKIRVKLFASPVTLYRYTLNREGAYRGWEITPDQAEWGVVPEKNNIEGLYLTGHWVTTPIGNGGVSSVAQLGRSLAKRILRSSRCKRVAAVTN